MSLPALCFSCGNALSPGRLRGLCPRCLMKSTVGPPAMPEAPDDSGFRIPGHENLRELARGGMGIVYQARQLAPEREVAIKMLLPQTITDELRERFRLEARTMADLNHPGILPLHQFGEWAGVPYFTMKLASGGTLATRRASYQGRWREIAALIAELADALAHAHEHGVLHRDLKPGNILFDENDRAYLADFGLVKIANVESHLTRSVAMLGTPQYLAPEVAAKDVREATLRSDIYSLGAVLYELLAQHPPFQAEGLPALLREITETEPAPLRKLGVPQDLATIAHTCLSKLPARRYSSAAALAADLRAWLGGQAIAVRPVSGMEKLWLAARRHPALALLSLLLFAAILTAVVLQHRANLSLKQTTHQALIAQVHAVRQSGQWALRNAGLEAARDAAKLGNDLELRNDTITLLATLGCGELDRRPYQQSTWAALSNDGQTYAEVIDKKLWIKAFSGTPADQEIPLPDASSVFDQAMSFSPDGGALLVVMEGSTFRIWQIKERAWAEVRYEAAWGLAFSPDGQWIAYGEDDSTKVTVENWRHPTERTTFDSALTSPAPISFSPDGKLLAIVTRGKGTLEIRDTLSGELVHRLVNQQWDPPFLAKVAWRPDSHAIAIVTSLTDVFVWYLDGSAPFRRRLAGHHAEVMGVAWHPSGEWLASIGFDFTLRLWEASSGRAGLIVPCGGSDLQFSADGRQLCLNDTVRKELMRYELSLPAVVHEVVLPRDSPDESWQRGPWGVGVSRDGRFAVVGGSLGTWVLDAAHGHRLATLNTGIVNDVRFTADGLGFWLCTSGQGISRSELTSAGAGVWALTTPYVFMGTKASVARLSESPETGVLAASIDNQLWLVKKNAAEQLDSGMIPLNPVAQSPDGRWAAAASCDVQEELAFVWDLEKKTPAQRLPQTRECYMVFSPDSRTLFTVSREELAAWDVGTWQPRWTRPNLGPIKQHQYPALSGDGRLLAISRLTHGVDLFDPSTGNLLATIDHPDARSIGWLALDGSGSRLAINGSEHIIQLWDLRQLRTKLQELQLDWPSPPLPPAPPEAATPVQAIIVLPAPSAEK